MQDEKLGVKYSLDTLPKKKQSVAMKLHPYVDAWRALLAHTGLRPRDIAKAGGFSESAFSCWLSGRRWPCRTSIAKVHRGLECLLGKQQGAVDKLVENMLITGGQVGGKLFEDFGTPIYPQFIPVLVHRPVGKKAKAGAGRA